MPTPANLSFHRASPAHTAEVLSVLNEAADWLRRRDVTQWPDRFEPSWIDEAITRGETWLVRAGDTAVGTLTLDWSDPLWADAAGSAGYVHHGGPPPGGRSGCGHPRLGGRHRAPQPAGDAAAGLRGLADARPVV
ncbi:hypothetical protein OHA25_36500 [Nonomuraea sp. NBC_00507]|uniref:hypothetical protein n=1 Tax=Nonomuraea sp. NBC_00507 TaxID=2976002 RepID=UPI002E193870